MKAPSSLKATRFLLGLAGVAAAGYGLAGLPTQLGPAQLIGLLVWMACAVLLHDGIVVPLSTLAGSGLRRFSFGLRPASAAVLRGALMVGAVTSLVVGILLKAQMVVHSVSAVEGDYAARLIWFWAALASATAVLIYLLERAGKVSGSRKQNTRP
ncbi:hypothetical protein [Arthrobacter sp. NA-172]|uniref:hypothetical protein n=1 Tax=Arthrobacter sp. NA-172 TaxID=3367524 RepID=UPI00375526FA